MEIGAFKTLWEETEICNVKPHWKRDRTGWCLSLEACIYDIPDRGANWPNDSGLRLWQVALEPADSAPDVLGKCQKSKKWDPVLEELQPTQRKALNSEWSLSQWVAISTKEDTGFCRGMCPIHTGSPDQTTAFQQWHCNIPSVTMVWGTDQWPQFSFYKL